MKTILQNFENSKKTKQLFIGVLSGTSMNSIDAILMDFANNHNLIIASVNRPFNKTIAKQLLAIIRSGKCNLQDVGTIDHKLGLEFAKAINKLLSKAKITPQQVTAIGCHGQNIWHEPFGKYPFTMQIGDPNIICAACNILTVADFRRKDMAHGGQGAPLAPSFHAAVFRSSSKNRAIINIGGISNITVLPKDVKQKIIGFDVGPGNCLMDEWVQTKFKKLQINYDKNGMLASTGKYIPNLLKICLQDPYFKKLPPKSTGREYFNQTWLNNKIKLAKLIDKKPYKNQDILATLLYLTAHVISEQIVKLNKFLIEEVYICGGGANNKALLALLKKVIDCPVMLTNELGIHVNWVEAALFAWLAKQTIEQQPGNLPSVTGALQPAVLGAIYLPSIISGTCTN